MRRQLTSVTVILTAGSSLLGCSTARHSGAVEHPAPAPAVAASQPAPVIRTLSAADALGRSIHINDLILAGKLQAHDEAPAIAIVDDEN